MASKPDNPAYRHSREAAERLFEQDMARYDEHQAACQVCVPLPPGSVIPTTTLGHLKMREDGRLCLHGGIVLWPAVQLAAGLKAGYYPDHARGKDGRCGCHRQIAAAAPVTCTDTPSLVGWGDTTSKEDTPMPSRATKAAEATARDAERRLKAVPDLPADQDKPLTKGDAARKAARDALEPWQQAVYDQIMEDGGRHVTALAQARKVTAPDPADAAPAAVDRTDMDVTLADNKPAPGQDVDVDALAADMFAAFAAMGDAGGAESLPDALPAITAQHQAAQDSGEAEVKPPAPKPVPVPQPKPQAAQPKPAAPKPPRPAPKPSEGATCTVQAVPFDRHLGTVTTADSVVHDCEHAARNGHIEKSAALGCAKRLLRNYPAGQVGTRVKSRYNGAYTPNGGEQVLCGCRFGHREEAAAITCAKARAAQAGLVA